MTIINQKMNKFQKLSSSLPVCLTVMSPPSEPTLSIAAGDLLHTLHAAVASVTATRRVLAAVDTSLDAATLCAIAGVWRVPCDIVGLESKKAKAAKIRFHPSTLERAREDASLAAAVRAAVDELISIVCTGGEWRLSASVPPSEAGAHAAKLRRLFSAIQPHVHITSEFMMLSWPLHTTPSTSKSATKAIKEAYALLKKQSGKVPLRARIESITVEGEITVDDKRSGEQIVEVECTTGDTPVPLWRLKLAPGYLTTADSGATLATKGGPGGDASGTVARTWIKPRFEMTGRGLHLHLQRSLRSIDMTSSESIVQSCIRPPSPPIDTSLPPQPPRLPFSHHGHHAVIVDDKGVEKQPIMLDVVQSRVEELRRKLDESLLAFQLQKLSAARTTGVADRQRQIIVLSADRTETAIEICEAGARPRMRPLAASSPLQVVVADGGVMGADGDGGMLMMMGGVRGNTDLASSPTESNDSGISTNSSSSPSSSPSAISPKASPFYQYSEDSSASAKLAMRSRSLSESASYSPVASRAPVLKGILKKTNSRDSINSNGRPLRGLFKRSVSESGDSSPFFILRSHSVFDDDQHLEEVIEEEDEEEMDEVMETPREQRTKRVSFSEARDEVRTFRAGSSIIGQKNKNARKERSKQRRREREGRSVSESDVTSDHVTTDDDSKRGSVDEGFPSLRDTRKDSGFVDEEDEDKDDDDVILSAGEEELSADDESEAIGSIPPSKSKTPSLGAAAASRPRAKAAAFTIGGPTPNNRQWMNAIHTRGRWASASN